MEDKDVQRLEDRIEAAEERGRLSLELVMSKVEARLDALQNVHATLLEAVRELRADNRQLREETSTQYRQLREETSTMYRESRSETSARFRELRTIVLGTGLAVVFGIAATGVGLMQVWTSGVQVGQAQNTPAAHTAPPGR